MSSQQRSQRITYLFALLTALAGLVVLLWHFARQRAHIDLATLLAFTLLALITTYFRVPIGPPTALAGEVGLTGSVLLGATLAGGPALGGWAAFLTGLSVGLPLAPAHRANPRPWPHLVADALFHGGRNVLAVEAAWAAYNGLGGRVTLSPRGLAQTVAVVVLCLTYTAVRLLWQWAAHLLSRSVVRSARGTRLAVELPSAAGFLAEVLPLPTALLIAVVFVRLGWPFFLLLAFLFTGIGAITYQLQRRIQDLQDDIAAREAAHAIRRAMLGAPHDLGALSAQAYEICRQLAPASRCELGLFDDLQTHVRILISVQEDDRLPPMRIPVTPLWEWMREHDDLQVYRDGAQLASLSFAMPGLGKDRPTQSAILAPICVDVAPDTRIALGGIVLYAAESDAFGAREARNIGNLVAYLARAIADAQAGARTP
ncbi:MAG: hypothetical protein JXA09_05935 [Anaerolineae bacterium]|nr:hypothetical protein [Anaerolineae bacterium]